MEAICRYLANFCCPWPAPTSEPQPQRPYVPPQGPRRPPAAVTKQHRQNYPVVQQPQPQSPLSYPSAHLPSRLQQLISPPQQEHVPSPLRYRDQNQQDDPHYVSLRQRAREAGAQMSQAFEASHAAYAGGDRARAKELSNEGKAHQHEMERLNSQASEWIFVENNQDRKPGEVDLHGLFVKEAIPYTERAIREARQRGDSRLNLIVGKGLHSMNGTAKLKPAIEALMQKDGLVAELDPNNAGVLIVNLDGRASGVGTIVKPDDVTRRLQSKNGECNIM